MLKLLPGNCVPLLPLRTAGTPCMTWLADVIQEQEEVFQLQMRAKDLVISV